MICTIPAERCLAGSPQGPRPLRRTLLLLLLLCLACGGNASTPREHAEWLTELEYRFTGTAEQGVLFNWASVRADPYRDRIFVLDARETQVSTWRPDGSLVFAVGRKGEGPGEFTRPSRIYFAEDGGFTVREGWGTRFTHYTANGELVGTEIGLTTSLTYQDTRLGLHAPTADGGYLAIPLFDSYRRAGLYGGLPMEREPILRVRRSEGGHWLTPEPIYWKSMRNYSQDHFQVERLDVPFFVPQYFADVVHTAFAHGKILVMQRAGGPPGSLDLLELNAAGDTLWERRLQFEPLKLTPEWIQEFVDMFSGPEFQFPMFSRAEHLKFMEAFEETLYKPEHLPAAQGFFLSASDEVWIKTFERSDTLRVYYTLPRGDTSGEPRRVLLPESLGAHDATATPRLGDPGRSPRRALRGRAAIDAKGGTVSQEV